MIAPPNQDILDEFDNNQPRLKAPKPRRHIRRHIEMKLFAFSTCFTFLLGVAYILLLLLQMLLVACWSTMYRLLDLEMSKTFAWEILVQMFGSKYNDCKDRSGTSTIRLTSYDHCSYDYTMPPIPIISLFLLAGFILSVIYFAVEKLYFNLSGLMLRIVYFFGILKAIFIFCAGISILLSYGSASDNLRIFMAEDMDIMKEPPHITPRWELTQLKYQCCGINNFTDWQFEMFENGGNPLYPQSCCDNFANSCNLIYPGRKQVWKQGCFKDEFQKITNYAFSAMYLLSLDLFCTILLVLVLTIMQTIPLDHVTCTIRIFKKRCKNQNKQAKSFPIGNSLDDHSLTKVQNDANNIPSSTSVNLNHIGNIDGQACGDSNAYSQRLSPNAEVAYQMQEQNATTANAQRSFKIPALFQRDSTKFNDLIVRRQTNIKFYINSWGIHYKMTCSSVTKTHVLKKETVV